MAASQKMFDDSILEEDDSLVMVSKLFEESLDRALEDYEEAMEVSDPASTPSVDPAATTSSIQVPEVITRVQPELPATSTAPVENSGSNHIAGVSIRKAKECSLCKKTHNLRFCFKFLKLSHASRLRHVVAFRHCARCLGTAHLTKDCPSLSKCRKCQGEHHTVLHSSPQKTVSQTHRRSTKNRDSVSRSNSSTVPFSMLTFRLPWSSKCNMATNALTSELCWICVVVIAT